MYIFTVINEPLRITVVGLLTIMAICQTLHVFFVSFQSRPEKGSPRAPFVTRLLYELSLVIYLLAMQLGIRIAGAGAAAFAGLSIAPDIIAGMGALPALFALVCIPFAKKRGVVAAEAVLLATGPLALIPDWHRFFMAVTMLAICYLVLRITRNTMEDEKLRRRTLTRFSTVDAINKLPVGVLCLADTGEVLVMNQSMRFCLQALGLPTDLADLSDIWERLEAKAAAALDTDEDNAPSQAGSKIGTSVASAIDPDAAGMFAPESTDSRPAPLILTANGRSHLFERRSMEWEGREHLTIIAVDVSQEEKLNQLIAQSNQQIVVTGQQIQASLEDVQHVAREEALRNLRAKVHDIIGQRLSILHRLLEDNRLSDESLAEIKPLLKNMLPDLLEQDFDAQTELDAIVDAFALIDVTVDVAGALPDDPAVANTFVDVIREATTNAVRHAQADLVSVDLRKTPTRHILTVCNSCAAGTTIGPTGTGIPNMRKAIERASGTLDVQTAPEFIIRASVPASQLNESEEQ